MFPQPQPQMADSPSPSGTTIGTDEMSITVTTETAVTNLQDRDPEPIDPRDTQSSACGAFCFNPPRLAPTDRPRSNTAHMFLTTSNQKRPECPGGETRRMCSRGSSSEPSPRRCFGPGECGSRGEIIAKNSVRRRQAAFRPRESVAPRTIETFVFDVFFVQLFEVGHGFGFMALLTDHRRWTPRGIAEVRREIDPAVVR